MGHYVLARDGTSEIIVKKSRFLGQARRVETPEEAAAIVAATRKEHWQARHHCTAMIVGEVERSSDDGEPAGTAGAPMLQVLRGHGLVGVLAIVTRYFGGTLLGTGGLIRAYGRAVTEAIEDSGLVPLIACRDVTVTCPAGDAGRCENAVRRFLGARGLGSPRADYGAQAQFTMTLPTPVVAELAAELAGIGPAWELTAGPEHLSPAR